MIGEKFSPFLHVRTWDHSLTQNVGQFRIIRMNYSLIQQVFDLWNLLPTVSNSSNLDGFKEDWTGSWKIRPPRSTLIYGHLLSPWIIVSVPYILEAISFQSRFEIPNSFCSVIQNMRQHNPTAWLNKALVVICLSQCAWFQLSSS